MSTISSVPSHSCRPRITKTTAVGHLRNCFRKLVETVWRPGFRDFRVTYDSAEGPAIFTSHVLLQVGARYTVPFFPCYFTPHGLHQTPARRHPSRRNHVHGQILAQPSRHHRQALPNGGGLLRGPFRAAHVISGLHNRSSALMTVRSAIPPAPCLSLNPSGILVSGSTLSSCLASNTQFP